MTLIVSQSTYPVEPMGDMEEDWNKCVIRLQSHMRILIETSLMLNDIFKEFLKFPSKEKSN